MIHCLLPVANLSSIGDFAALRQAIHNLGRFLYRTIFKSEEKAAILCDNLQVDQSQKSNAETAFIGRFFAATSSVCLRGFYLFIERHRDSEELNVHKVALSKVYSCKLECLWYCVDTGLVTFSSQKPCRQSVAFVFIHKTNIRNVVE